MEAKIFLCADNHNGGHVNNPEPPPILPPSAPPVKQRAPGTPSPGCLIVVVIALVIFGISKVYHPGDGRPGQSETVDACHDAIRGQLTNPDSADFQSTLTTDYQKFANGYDVSGSVSAENDSGVKTSYTFSCTLDKDDNVLSAYLN